jgi:hypothetical protein
MEIITKKEFIAKWGFGNDLKLNEEFLNDLIEVIRAEVDKSASQRVFEMTISAHDDDRKNVT